MYVKRSWGLRAKEISEWGVGGGEEGWEGFEAFRRTIAWDEFARAGS
jgi:hypothetical protein